MKRLPQRHFPEQGIAGKAVHTGMGSSSRQKIKIFGTNLFYTLINIFVIFIKSQLKRIYVYNPYNLFLFRLQMIET